MNDLLAWMTPLLDAAVLVMIATLLSSRPMLEVPLF